MRSILRRIVTSGPGWNVRPTIKRMFHKHARVFAIAIVVSLLVGSLPASSYTSRGLPVQTRSSVQQQITLPQQLYRGVSNTVASIGGWLAGFVANDRTSHSNSYQPVAAYLSPAPPFIDAPTSLTVTAASSTSINLSWTAPISGGVDHYVVERSENINGPFAFVANVTGATTKNDTTVTNLHAYLYRVRAVSTTGAISSPSNMALGTAISFQFSSLAGQEIRAQHFHDVRTAINAVRPVANLAAATWVRGTLTGLEVKADDVNEMRTALNEALTALAIPATAYTDPTLNVGANGTLIKAIHVEELQTRSTRGSSSSSGPIDPDSSTARLDPLNETGGGGENPLSRNFNWSLPLVSLPGRAEMDLGLSLTYNSLVWTKISSNAISFDDDNGFPGPGFRLGFPVIQQRYFNSQVGKEAYLVISPDGSRTELRQVGTSAFYEAADSSHLLLDENTMILRTTDGTQLEYVPLGGEFKCTKIKDRNGNYISVSYTPEGRINTVTDTLNRVITFNYVNGLLDKITQIWNDNLPNEVTHEWARFEYADKTIDTNFPGLTVHGPADSTSIKTLTKVRLADNSCYEFTYTSWGQVWKVTRLAADGSVLNYRTYDLPQTGTLAHDDCPRFTVRKDWAKYWNGNTDGTIAVSEEVATATFIIPTSDSWTMPDNTAASGVRAEVTSADGTLNKIYFVGTAGNDSGWKRGLPALVVTESGGQWKRKVMTTWSQDDDTSLFVLNPRVKETNVYDPEGNRARTEIDYGDPFSLGNGMSCHLPRDVFEYAADASTKLRSARTIYNMTASYTDRRILGLVSEEELYEGPVNPSMLKSKVSFFYDDDNGSSSIQGTDAPVQHDNGSYSSSFVTGRGNLSSVKRHNVDNGQSTTSRIKYNTAGSVVSFKDASDHVTTSSYADSFSDGNNSRNTLAYPTKVTDPDTFETTTKYNFDFGAVTSERTPKPNETTNKPENERPERVFTFDSLGRLEQITNSVNSAYTRFVYSTAQNRVDTYQTIQQGLGEARSFEITDGHGRTVAKATDHPSGTAGSFSGQRMIYDTMGRLFKTSNPAETTASGHAPLWSAVGVDAGWIFTEQTYDWRGRPLVTTNPSLTSNPAQTTTKTVSYVGCGCAGGEVITFTDEVGRIRKDYTDVLGRTFKTEALNPDTSVYSTSVNNYNVRDQVKEVKQYAGSETSSTFQVTEMTYDGFGRLSTRHSPEQQAGTSTSWTYHADDRVSTITDARGASQTFSHNGRHLVTGIVYSAGGSGVPTPGSVTLAYDAAGNRTSMIDGLGSKSYQYDLLSRLTQETRQLSVGSFGISYSYNLADQLNSITDPFGDSFTHTRNVQGQLTAVTGSPYAGWTSYISNVVYRAWGAPKSITYTGGATTTIAYNARLMPSEYRGFMREDYSYYGDGRLASLTDLDDTAGTNPPTSLRFLSRAFTYDHVGRVSSGFGTGTGGGGVPFSQNYSYDAFGNMTGRSGSYYNYNNAGPTSDNSTYVNNRRTNWSYNLDGQVTSTPSTSTDSPRTMTYDAAGRMITSVENGPNNTVTYTTSYDGDGKVVFESSTTSPGTSESSYIIRSTVLRGEVLTRLDQSGNKKITHVPAEGLLFATQNSSGAPGAFVNFIVRNPLGISETSKAVYDPLGNYIPFRAHPDPRPPAGSYNSASMRGLSSSQANPDGYAVGCIMDGIPTNCNRVMQAVSRDQAKSISIHGLAVSPSIMRLMASFMTVTYTRTLRLQEDGSISDTITPGGEPGHFEGGYSDNYASWVITRYVIAPGSQTGFEQTPTTPQHHATIGYGRIQGRADRQVVRKVCNTYKVTTVDGVPVSRELVSSNITGINWDSTTAAITYSAINTGQPAYENPLLGLFPGDVRGHIIGRALGGSGNAANLFSQSPRMNNSAYKKAENAVRKTLTKHKDWTANLMIQLLYKPPTCPGTTATEFRPEAIIYGVTYVDREGRIRGTSIDFIPN